MEISGSNEVKYFKIAPTKSFKLHHGGGWKKRQNKLPQTRLMLAYVYME